RHAISSREPLRHSSLFRHAPQIATVHKYDLLRVHRGLPQQQWMIFIRQTLSRQHEHKDSGQDSRHDFPSSYWPTHLTSPNRFPNTSQPIRIVKSGLFNFKRYESEPRHQAGAGTNSISVLECTARTCNKQNRTRLSSRIAVMAVNYE